MRKIPTLFLLIFTIFFVGCGEQPTKKEAPLVKRDTLCNTFPITYRGHIYIKGDVDSVSGNFVFDTGATNLYLDSIFYKENSFSYQNTFDAYIPGAGINQQKIKVIDDIVTFRFDKHLYQTKRVPVIVLKPILGDYADGILGLQYFNSSVMEINYKEQFIRVSDNIDSIDISNYSRITFKNQNDRLFIPLKVNINNAISIEGEYLLDFGSGNSVSITTPTARNYRLQNSINKKVGFYTKYGGIGGESASYDFMAKSVEIGGFTMKDVTMDYSTDKKGAMASSKHNGLIGNKILEQFDIIIDFANNHLYIKPNSDYGKPFRFSKLGFSFVDRYKTLNAWIVTGMYNNCNAEKAGLKIDDKIVSINGTEVKNIGYENQREFIEKLTDITLTIERNGERSEIIFRTKPVL
jgi:hypothetical protein